MQKYAKKTTCQQKKMETSFPSVSINVYSTTSFLVADPVGPLRCTR
jgi:hypothetical protein